MSGDNLRFTSVLGEEYDLLKLAYPHYDEFEGKVGQFISDYYRRSTLEVIKVLDIGCGTGITTKILLDCDPRVQVVAIDNEPKMIRQIKDNLKLWRA